MLLNAVGFYVILSCMPTHLSQELGLDRTSSYLATTVALGTCIGFILLPGMLSDRFGRKRVLMSATVLFLLCTVPAFHLLGTGSLLVALGVQVLLGAMLSLNDGTLPSYLAEMFPTTVRCSGFAVSFNLSNTLFGGTAPLVATWLIPTSGDDAAPGWYLMGRPPSRSSPSACPPRPAAARCSTAERTPDPGAQGCGRARADARPQRRRRRW